MAKPRPFKLVGDPTNYLGARLNEPIGELPAAPIDPNWKSVWDRGTGDRGFELASRNPTSLRPFPAAMLAPPKEPTTQYTLANPPRLGTSKANRDSRGYSTADVSRFALQRARAGMSLNDDERMALEGMAAQAPGGLASLLAGSRAEQSANAQETVRQRGMARGAARAGGKAASAAMRAGAPRGLASLYAMPAGAMNDPVALSAAGIVGPGVAEAMMESANNRERNAIEREKLGMAADLAGLGSVDPLIARAAARNRGLLGSDSGDGSLPAAVDASGNPVPSLNLTNDQALELESLGGDPKLIEQYGAQQNWSKAKIDLVKSQYAAGPLDRLVGFGSQALGKIVDKAAPKLGDYLGGVPTPEAAALNLNPLLTGGIPMGGSLYDWARRKFK